jgi:high-affinity Fe2+/Pb2+ permease
LAIVGVASEALLGVNCPLTVLEFKLRYALNFSEKEVSFIGTIVDSLLFYNAPGWLFTIVYTAFAILVVITFIIAPPSRKSHEESVSVK